MVKCRGFWQNIPIFGRNSIDKKNRRILKNRDFSIVSNNCIGGVMCHDLNEQFRSPFVNLYILPKDYLKLLSNLKVYLDTELIECTNHELPYPVGLLGDIHIYFMHYDSFEIAKEKWDIRKRRMNYDNLFVIFSERDGCTEEDIRQFGELPYKNKVCFTHHVYAQYDFTYAIKDCVKNDELGVITDYRNERLKIRYLDSFDYVSWLNAKK